MPVPEAAVDLYGGPAAGEHQVGPGARDALVQPEAQATRVQEPAKRELRGGVPPPDAGHALGPLLRRQGVGQLRKTSWWWS